MQLQQLVDYKYFYFTSPGSLTVANDGTDAPMLTDFMLVGQGGQGQSTGGGGGGAGAFIQKINYELGPFQQLLELVQYL